MFNKTFSAVLTGAVSIAVLTPIVSLAQQRDTSAQIASAVLPLPEAMRAGATVVSVDKGVETVLRMSGVVSAFRRGRRRS